MSDLINRRMAIAVAKGFTFTSSTDRKRYVDFLHYCLSNAPTVEAVPVVHGEWFDNICSSCQLRWDENMVNNADDWGYFNPMPNFCPNCGADMRRKVQE